MKKLLLLTLPSVITMPLLSVSCFNYLKPKPKVKVDLSKYFIKDTSKLVNKINDFNNAIKNRYITNSKYQNIYTLPDIINDSYITANIVKWYESKITLNNFIQPLNLIDKQKGQNDYQGLVYSKSQNYADLNSIKYQYDTKSFIYDKWFYDPEFNNKNTFEANLKKFNTAFDLLKNKLLDLINQIKTTSFNLDSVIKEYETTYIDYLNKAMLYKEINGYKEFHYVTALDGKNKTYLKFIDRNFLNSNNVDLVYKEDNKLNIVKNPAFINKKMAVLKNHKDGFSLRAMSLFQGLGQATMLYCNDNYLYALTSLHVVKPFLKKISSGNDYDVYKLNEMGVVKDKFNNKKNYYLHHIFKYFDNSGQIQTITKKFDIDVFLEKNNLDIEKTDQAILRFNLINKAFNNTRAYNNKIKLNNEVTIKDNKLYYNNNSYFKNNSINDYLDINKLVNDNNKVITPNNHSITYGSNKSNLWYDYDKVSDYIKQDINNGQTIDITNGLNLNQFEYFNAYDFNSNNFYSTASNMFINKSYIRYSVVNNQNPYDIVKLFRGWSSHGTSGMGLGNSKYKLDKDITNLFNSNSKEKLIDIVNNSYKNLKETDILAYDEMKYILRGAITNESDYYKQLDKNGIPKMFMIAEPIRNSIINIYNILTNRKE